ncbi:hypothetical protein AHAS_Ahas04G0265200 [Arachis hypogaea]
MSLTSLLPSTHTPNSELRIPDIQTMSYNYANATATLDRLLHDTSNNSPPTGFDFIEELIRAADCFDTNHLHVAHVILDQLNQRLRSPAGAKPLQCVAFYFKKSSGSQWESGEGLTLGNEKNNEQFDRSSLSPTNPPKRADVARILAQLLVLLLYTISQKHKQRPILMTRDSDEDNLH